VHLGHVALAETAWRRCALERVVFLPAWQSPHKQDEAPPAPADHRLAMLRLALAATPWAVVDAWEVDRGGPSYSWQTAEHFAGLAGPEVELCWLLGADQWARLHTWAHPEKLAARLTFLVFPRGETPVEPRPGVRHQFIDFRHPASATAARAAACDNRPLDGLVAPAVAGYIRRHGLYQAAENQLAPA